ncbi:hypothetical protein ANME2D_02457 [Candidatus Methanoperedens nitroreducens]|uniref:Uncharacterized protein n=1 Tax=Candidatus Methanoperedens nitratireducens TaxID=1392998 RepID=A0A062UW63_9EURY|nr:hypothetical protein [Candidatus Methanoperedens nitroreducens]KCZ71256.1 hypothetical protein ANME2D_02457 [Candidatus Methanoperedens nitroreducens]MDJ1420318.1 hypothetical protein [Candidatus Methanoperedens sp.]
MDNKQVSIIAVIALAFLAGLYLLTPETRNIAVSIRYQDPVYETRTIAVSVPYQEAVYGTFYYGKLEDTGLTTYTWTIDRATDYSKEYTGKDFWGSPEYTFKVCWGSQCTNYPQINTWSISPKTEITGYETKYKTEYQKETYLARYETKYRTEYKDITKTKLEWIFS